MSLPSQSDDITTDDPEFRICSLCKTSKPLATDFYFLPNGKPKARCKACFCMKVAEHRNSKNYTPRVATPFVPTCRTCGQAKDSTEFPVDRQTGKLIRECKPCRAERSRVYREAHAQELAEKRRERLEKNREDHLQNRRDRYRRIREENPLPPKPSYDDPKICKKCGELKDAEHFKVTKKDTGYRDANCIPCSREYYAGKLREYRADKPEHFKEYSRKYTQENRENIRAAQREQRRRNPEKARARDRISATSPHRRESKKQYQEKNRLASYEVRKIYDKRNHDRILVNRRNRRARNPQKYRDQNRRWKLANPEKWKAIERSGRHRRRALLAGAEGSFTHEEWMEILDKHDHRCWICGMGAPLVKLTVDHIIPLSKGGSNYASNLAPACKPCNSFKGNRLMGFPSFPSKRKRKRNRPLPIESR